MIFQTQEVLFFTLNNNRAKSFNDYITTTGMEFRKFSSFIFYREVNGKEKTFRHIQELAYILERLELERLANFIVIIDYNSLPDEDLSREEYSDEVFYSKKIKELILQYPEVKFVFEGNDDGWLSLFKETELQCKLEDNYKCEKCISNKECKIKIKYIHEFNYFVDNAFALLINGKSNLFDASNLRNAIKQEFFGDDNLKIQTNYPKTQCSRNNNLALCIDEEIQQSYFNSYAMYIHGFRAMPVVSYRELEKIANDTEKIIDEKDIKIIIRDYDLQFEDGDPEEIHYLRGMKRETDKWSGVNKTIDDKVGEKKKVTFWDKFKVIDTYFVSRFDESDNDNTPNVQPPSQFSKEFKRQNNQATNEKSGIRFTADNKKAYLSGLPKPVDGLMEFRTIPEVSKNVDIITETTDFKINRNEGGHSVSPFITHIAESLISRSHNYYNNGHYMLAALLAKEATEVLNGFHLMMMLDATHLQSISENAMVMSILGGDERKLANHTTTRLNQIECEINRICIDNPGARKNVLNQIYNDIRHTCRSKEQFKSADVALGKMIENRFAPLNALNFIQKHKNKRNYKIKKNNVFLRFLTYLKNFGWMYLLFFIVYGIIAMYCKHEITVWVAIAGLILFVVHPLPYVYSLVSSKTRLWTFLLMFSVTQIGFSFVYYQSYFKDNAKHSIIVQKEMILEDNTKDVLPVALNASFMHVVISTFHTSLLQETAPLFVNYMENEKPHPNLKTSLFNIMLIFQIFVSWIYLGVLISSLYQKLRNE